MPNEFQDTSRDELRSLWSELPASPHIAPDEIRRRANWLVGGRRGYAITVAGFVTLTFVGIVFLVWHRDVPLAAWEWLGLGYLAVINVALLWMTGVSVRRMGAVPVSSDCVSSYRSLLEQARNSYRGRILAMRVALPLGAAGQILFVGNSAGLPATAGWLAAAALVALSGFGWQRSRHRAQLFQAHIDALDRSVANVEHSSSRVKR